MGSQSRRESNGARGRGIITVVRSDLRQWHANGKRRKRRFSDPILIDSLSTRPGKGIYIHVGLVGAAGNRLGGVVNCGVRNLNI